MSLTIIKNKTISFTDKVHHFYDELRAIFVDNNHILVSVGKTVYKIINDEDIMILGTANKSIKSIDSNKTLLGYASYDGTVSLFTKTTAKLEFFDVIEGPTTEIKQVFINDDFIVLATRGQMVWILNITYLDNMSFQITVNKIIEDHMQDVKGAKIVNHQLYSWSYDNTIRIYNYFFEEWELDQVINCDSIVWNVHFINDMLIAITNTSVQIYHKKGNQFFLSNQLYLSITECNPSLEFTLNDQKFLILTCNITVICILNSQLEIIVTYNMLFPITSLFYHNYKLYVGSNNILHIFTIVT